MCSVPTVLIAIAMIWLGVWRIRTSAAITVVGCDAIIRIHIVGGIWVGHRHRGVLRHARSTLEVGVWCGVMSGARGEIVAEIIDGAGGHAAAAVTTGKIGIRWVLAMKLARPE